jgi:imidazoleglycerol-phosphate dehydratase
MIRTCEIKRETKETNISIKLNLDGIGNSNISTTIPFLDHMLTLFAKHGKFDLDIKAFGDTEIDNHHLIEDLGITLGKALDKCLLDKKGIERYGFSAMPMDETLVACALDISGRPFLVYNMNPFDNKELNSEIMNKIQEFSREKETYELYKHFFYSLSYNSGITLHFNLKYGENLHHNLEASFKAFGQALKKAVFIDEKYKDICPSTKGCI